MGTARKPLLLEAGGQIFIAPDNGVLSMIAARDKKWNAREITNRGLWLDSPSSTFHGRDIFAPVAAALASGQAKPEDVGPILRKIELLSDLQPREIKPGYWQGRLLSVDRFGNAITNFRAAEFPMITSHAFSLRVRNRRITKFQGTFGDAPNRLCFAYIGSSGYIEVAMKEASAAALLNARPGDPVTLRLLDLHK